MTKEITKAFILQQIEDKFKLRDLVPEKFTFSETVLPVYNIEQHLKKWEVLEKTVSITSATGFLFFFVPPTERWCLRAYQIIFGGTGAHKGTGLYVTHRPSEITEYIYLDMKKDQDVSYVVNLPVPVVLDPGCVLRYFINSYTSTQDLTIDVDVQKEIVR